MINDNLDFEDNLPREIYSADEIEPNSILSFEDLFSDDTQEFSTNSMTIKAEPTVSFNSDDYSALKLFNFDYQELPKLIDPIFPQIGLASLVGSSDTGKSTFLRQLAVSIAMGLDKFVGYKLNPIHRNVIFISTEDDPVSTSISIKKPVSRILKETKKDIQLLNHLKFIFEVDTNADSSNNIIKVLEKDLLKTPVDLVVVDAFTDIFSGDINSSTKVREFLNQFSKLAKAHNCLILFLHHTGKKTHKFTASKDNILGSQAFEAKMRVVLELKQYPNDENLRTLTVTKGNYISSKVKKFSKVLSFDEETLLFQDTGKNLHSDSLASLAYTNPKKDDMLPIIENLHKEKKSIRQIEAELKKSGYKIGKSTVGNYIKELKMLT
ncbi:AAA family ATPase [Moheibacter sediminis]|uniref:AAA domain-containing protein n=1 Tax=Moheibacter sediminis TaxID=1434700 RepID=A0A1W1YC11_9FLAO|nr:AAA family ATPase [Moheibacter sediminis]SMC33685.1 AAA domain-containing protein [Moheibacter sediminis]